jgi:hypothetical protein
LIFFVSYIQWGVHPMHLKTLFNGKHSQKNIVCFILMNISIIKNDTQVYCGINSLHKRLNTKNLKHKIWKGEYELQVPPTTPYVFEKKGQIIIPIDACIERSHSSTTSQYIMSHTNISKLPSFYGWIIILFEIYL